MNVALEGEKRPYLPLTFGNDKIMRDFISAISHIICKLKGNMNRVTRCRDKINTCTWDGVHGVGGEGLN